jgi:hypothetical protein
VFLLGLLRRSVRRAGPSLKESDDGLRAKMPRLFTRMSVSCTSAISFRAPSSVPRSASTARTTPGSEAIAASSFFALRPGTATSTPSSASKRAIARPIPAEPPVTIAFLPLSCRSTVQSSICLGCSCHGYSSVLDFRGIRNHLGSRPIICATMQGKGAGKTGQAGKRGHH